MFLRCETAGTENIYRFIVVLPISQASRAVGAAESGASRTPQAAGSMVYAVGKKCAVGVAGHGVFPGGQQSVPRPVEIGKIVLHIRPLLSGAQFSPLYQSASIPSAENTGCRNCRFVLYSGKNRGRFFHEA